MLNSSNFSALIWIICWHNKWTSELIDKTCPKHNLEMENRNLKLIFANFTISGAKWELPRSQDVRRDGYDPVLIKNRKIVDRI